jgi:hypothetical protein
VNRHWSAAAVAATHIIEVSLDASESRRVGVLQWIEKHGLLLSQLKLHGGHGLMSSLPCPGLRELLIRGSTLQLTPRGGQPGLLHAATGLTQLVLLRATVLGAQQLTALSVLTDLQHLVLSELQEPSLQYAAVPEHLLSQLQRLTHLQIVSGLSDAALQHLSCLTNLQQLQLERLGADTTPAAVEHVARLQQLTCLLLEGAHFTLGDVSTPSVAALTGLSVLQLHACNGMQAGMLSTLTSLQVLQLQLTPVESAGQFLTLLPKLRRLTALELDAALVQGAPSTSAYVALTANSNLQALQLSSAWLPAGAWDAMFPAHGLQAPAQLTSLRLAYCEEQIGGKALEGLVRCCPRLERFHLSGRAQLGSSLRQLRQLSVLTELGLSHVTGDVAEVVAQLPGLSSLVFMQPSYVSDHGVMQLTQLTRLTYLWVSSECLSREMRTAGNRTMLQLVSWLLPADATAHHTCLHGHTVSELRRQSCSVLWTQMHVVDWPGAAPTARCYKLPSQSKGVHALLACNSVDSVQRVAAASASSAAAASAAAAAASAANLYRHFRSCGVIGLCILSCGNAGCRHLRAAIK